jgi:hypothetical protein
MISNDVQNVHNMYIVYPVLLEVSTKVETLESRSRVDTQYGALRDSKGSSLA